MSNLVVLGFDGLHTADEVLNKLRSLQKDYLIDLEDACVVEPPNTGAGTSADTSNWIAPAAAIGAAAAVMAFKGRDKKSENEA